MNFKIKQKKSFGNITLVLFDMNDRFSVNTSNLFAFDKNGYLLWSAECPPTGHFSEFQIEEDSNTVEANQSSVLFYTISLEDGRIKSTELRK